MSRRTFLTQSAGLLAGAVLGRSAWSDEPARDLQLATFRFDATPPKGHSLCGGWITPVQNVETPLQAIGLVSSEPDSPSCCVPSIGPVC